MRLLLAFALFSLLALGPVLAEDSPPLLIGRLYVKGDGPVRVEADALEKLGASSPAHVEVRRHGRRVPSRVEDGDLHFEATDTAGAHTVHAAYRLWQHPEPLPSAGPDTASEPGSHHVLAADRFYGALGSAKREVYSHPAPVWYLARIFAGKMTKLELAPAGLDPAGSLVLTAEIRTAHMGAVAVAARWGDVDLGTAETETAAAGTTLTWSVPEGKAPAGAAPLTLTDVSPPIPKPLARDVSAGRGTVWIDRVTLVGARAPEPTARQVRTLVPTPIERLPDPLAAAGSARHVIIAVPALVDEARRLAAHRTATGTPSAVVPVTGIYESYGFGEHTPQAIRKFVLALMAREDAPLDYLLLAGDATLDRTDMLPDPTIPTLMGRSMYNGATAADPLYVVAANGEIKGSPALGRLPFRKAETLRAYVDRVIAYETKPPAHPSRRMFRFITSEGRFGATIDGMIERKFRGVIAEHIAPAFDIEVTFASKSSPFLWPPPELNDKVIHGLNAGALFLTYVGHGFARGFDTLRVNGERHRILHVDDAGRVAVEGTPPVVFVLACTTAQFDGLQDGIGEALMKQPGGPVAYWGASRICHPLYNAVIGQAIATHMARTENAAARGRLGQVLRAARDEGLAGDYPKEFLVAEMMFGGGAKLTNLIIEGAMMYTLLGDPALKPAFPREDLRVDAVVEDDEVIAVIRADLPAGTVVHVSLELPRDKYASDPKPVADPGNPDSFPAIREKHKAMNDWALLRREVELAEGRAEIRLPLGEHDPEGLVVKAWSIADGDVHQGATVLD